MEFILLLAFIIIGLKVIKSSKLENLSSKQKDYRKYLGTAHWIETKALARRRACFKCEICGYNRKLQVHHKTYRNIGAERPEDLIVLCSRCHARQHHKYK